MKQPQTFAKLVLITTALLLAGCSSSGTTDTSAAPTTMPATTIPATTVASVAPTITLSPTAGLPAGVAGDLPNGVYRDETTDADLNAVNVPEDTWAEAHGTYTWTLIDGSWSVSPTAPNPIQYPTAQGVYVVAGDHITFHLADSFGPQEFTWAVDADDSLVLAATQHRQLLRGHSRRTPPGPRAVAHCLLNRLTQHISGASGYGRWTCDLGYG